LTSSQKTLDTIVQIVVILLTVADENYADENFLGDRKVIQTWKHTIKHTNGSLAIEQMRNGRSLFVSLCVSFENLDYQLNSLRELNIPERKD
jgi:hypothetical protein